VLQIASIRNRSIQVNFHLSLALKIEARLTAVQFEWLYGTAVPNFVDRIQGGLTQKWLRVQAEAGAIPCLRADSRFLFDFEAVEAALAERAAQTRGGDHEQE
jgi:hypothetical protein